MPPFREEASLPWSEDSQADFRPATIPDQDSIPPVTTGTNKPAAIVPPPMTNDALALYAKWTNLALRFQWSSFRRSGHLQKHYQMLESDQVDPRRDDSVLFYNLSAANQQAAVEEMVMRYEIIALFSDMWVADTVLAVQLAERLVAPGYRCKGVKGTLVVGPDLAAPAWTVEITNAIHAPARIGDVWVLASAIVDDKSINGMLDRMTENLTALQEV